MPSTLFFELYEKAAAQDCAALHKVVVQLAVFGEAPVLVLTHAADAMVADGDDFHEDFFAAVRKRGLAQLNFTMRCPRCGRATCGGALPSVSIPAEMLEHLLAGGTPFDYVES